MNKLLPAILILFGFVITVQANPVVVIITGGFSIPESTALLGESLVIAVLLSYKKFRFIRTLCTWPLITLLTYWLFLLGFYVTYGGLIGIGVLEILVILGEAWIIHGLSKKKFYRTIEEPISKKAALTISALGNLASIIIGLAWGFKL